MDDRDTRLKCGRRGKVEGNGEGVRSKVKVRADGVTNIPRRIRPREDEYKARRLQVRGSHTSVR